MNKLTGVCELAEDFPQVRLTLKGNSEFVTDDPDRQISVTGRPRSGLAPNRFQAAQGARNVLNWLKPHSIRIQHGTSRGAYPCPQAACDLGCGAVIP
jgi:hypothetical protein